MATDAHVEVEPLGMVAHEHRERRAKPYSKLLSPLCSEDASLILRGFFSWCGNIRPPIFTLTIERKGDMAFV